jgi:general secretion pathway protein G
MCPEATPETFPRTPPAAAKHRGFTLIGSPGGFPLVAPRTPPDASKRRGFTLIELLVVMAIIGTLAAIGIPMLLNTPVKAKEAALKENLFTFRSCLDQYKADKGRYPESLEVLVQEKYIRKVPLDPFTKSADTWELVFEEPDSAEAASEEPAGIIDVKSGSDKTALDGTSYNTW